MSAHTRQIRRRLRRRQNIKEVSSFVAIIAAVVGVMWFCASVWFPYADCQSSTNALQFIERCEAHADCSLRPHDIQQKDLLIRKQLRSCK
jgi:hypothetical protein